MGYEADMAGRPGGGAGQGPWRGLRCGGAGRAAARRQRPGQPAEISGLRLGSEVIILTGACDADGAELAIHSRAWGCKFSAAESTSGKKYEDNSGAAISLSCNSPIYFFSENLIITPIESTPIDFNTTSGGFIRYNK